jgi:hypothetical protein
LTFNRQHDIISQKIVLVITTAVRTSNPTQFLNKLENTWDFWTFSTVQYSEEHVLETGSLSIVR